MNNGDDSNESETGKLSFLQKVRKIAEDNGIKTGFCDLQRNYMNEEDIDKLRQKNAHKGNEHYKGIPDESVKTGGRFAILSARISRLLPLIEGERLADNKRSQAIVDVASQQARAPHIRWCKNNNEPVVVNGRHRIAALHDLNYFAADIVCLSEYVDDIKGWILAAPSNPND